MAVLSLAVVVCKIWGYEKMEPKRFSINDLPRGLSSARRFVYGFVFIFPAMMSILICSNSILIFAEMRESNW